ncbi:MAG: SGNH/GDSL hydrolase family protein [Lachnospiraceae bacterium]|nr:SGNH/GDSL hydrolase family protein [Lachnospiraceae bacterium]
MNKKLLKTLIPTILLAAVLIAAVGSLVMGRSNRTNDPTAESRAADYSENEESKDPEGVSEGESNPAGPSAVPANSSETETETESETETETETEAPDPLSVKRIWVGDSRIVGLTTCGLGDPELDTFIGKNGRYYIWFYNDALPVLREHLDTGEQYEVIVQIGINDCANKQMRLLSYYGEDYAKLINSLIDEYPNARFWFLSIGEVIGTYGGGTQWEVKMKDLNPLVGPFNEIMRTECRANYLPVGELIKEEHRSYADNVHYSEETNKWLYDYVLEAIKNTVEEETQAPTVDKGTEKPVE